MDYKNDNRTPRDRITGEFLSELLFTEAGGCSEKDQNCGVKATAYSHACTPPSVARRRNANCADQQYMRKERKNGVEITGSYSLAMAYVQMQEYGELFDPEVGFCEGTIYKSLRYPFYPTPCRKEFQYK